MKKLLLPLFAAALAMSGCNLQNHFSFDQIEFDYPASWEVVGKDVDEDQMTIMLSVSDEDIRSIFSAFRIFSMLKGKKTVTHNKSRRITIRRDYLQYYADQPAAAFVDDLLKHIHELGSGFLRHQI